MKRGVIWTWAAEIDAQEIFAHSEDVMAGGGLRIVTFTEQLLALLQQFPRMAPVWKYPVRRVGVRKTPYALFYVVEPTRIVVIGLQDGRRDPDRLRKEILGRLPG